MRITHLNNFDLLGGAARACYSIHQSLLKNNYDSKLLVQKKISDDSTVFSFVNSPIEKGTRFIRKAIDYSSSKILCREEYGRFSIPFFSPSIYKYPHLKNADIINLHWVNEGFISLNSLTELGGLNKPIVWTLHDMWAFTGGCHYTDECVKFISGCSNCPALRVSGKRDLSTFISKSKKEVFDKLNLSIVTSSNWLGEEAKKSFLLKDKKVFVAPTAIDVNLFTPREKKLSKSDLQLNSQKLNLLFGTMNISDKRKGMFLLTSAINIFSQKFPEYKDKIEISVFGSLKTETLPSLPYKINFLGHKHSNEEIAECYNAADIFIAPSTQDNLPNTVLESLACGTPVVAFNIGGMPDMIDHKQNGYLAEPFSEVDLADGIKWVLDQSSINKSLAENSRQKALDNYTFEKVGQKYYGIYQELLK